MTKNIYLYSRKLFLNLLARVLSNDVTYLNAALIRKILFVRIDRIGDLVLSTPALNILKKNYPHASITVLASRSNSSVVLNNPHVDECIVYDRQGGVSGLVTLLGRLRSFCFDLAIDPFDDYELKSALIVFLSGAKYRVGYSVYGKEVFYNLKVKKRDGIDHFMKCVLRVLEPLGIKDNNFVPEIFLTSEELYQAKKWLKNMRVKAPFIGVHPGAYYESQRWPTEYFAELIDQARRKHLEVLLFGGIEDREIIDRILSSIDQIIPYYVGDDLRQFMALLAQCCLFVCNNSGPLHIACALGVPTISFMGPTVKERWIPIGDQHKVLRLDNLPCIGCGAGTCIMQTHDCMRHIRPDTVMDLIEKII